MLTAGLLGSSRSTYRTTLPLLLAVGLFVVLAALNLLSGEPGTYSALAKSVLSGKLYYISPLATDTALFEGKHYSPFGLLPTLIALPFVALGYYHQGAINLLLIVGVFYVCQRIALRLGYNLGDSYWLAFAFCFGTAFVDAAFFPLQIAHTLAVLFSLLSIKEYLSIRRGWVNGLYLGLAVMSRPMVAFWILFFFFALLSDTRHDKYGKVFSLCGAFGLFVLTIAIYNYVRFGTPLESGYNYEIYFGGIPYRDLNVPGNIPGPLFSFSYFPVNFSIFAFGLPNPQGVTVSPFLISPFLIYLLSGKRWERTDWLIAVNAVIAIAVLLCFRSIAFSQASCRYSLDFMPFVFWLLLRRHTELTTTLKFLILTAAVFDLWLISYFVWFRFY